METMRRPSTLNDVLKEYGSLTRLAREVHASVSHLCDIRLGRRSPSLALAVRISRATGVPVESLLRHDKEAA